MAEAERAAVEGSTERIDADRIDEVKLLVANDNIKTGKISASEQLRT